MNFELCAIQTPNLQKLDVGMTHAGVNADADMIRAPTFH
jgi:hypothetical protein